MQNVGEVPPARVVEAPALANASPHRGVTSGKTGRVFSNGSMVRPKVEAAAPLIPTPALAARFPRGLGWWGVRGAERRPRPQDAGGATLVASAAGAQAPR